MSETALQRSVFRTRMQRESRTRAPAGRAGRDTGECGREDRPPPVGSCVSMPLHNPGKQLDHYLLNMSLEKLARCARAGRDTGECGREDRPPPVGSCVSMPLHNPGKQLPVHAADWASLVAIGGPTAWRRKIRSPAALGDCYSALTWLASLPAVDPARPVHAADWASLVAIGGPTAWRRKIRSPAALGDCYQRWCLGPPSIIPVRG